jgi:hypothetical protein
MRTRSLAILTLAALLPSTAGGVSRAWADTAPPPTVLGGSTGTGPQGVGATNPVGVTSGAMAPGAIQASAGGQSGGTGGPACTYEFAGSQNGGHAFSGQDGTGTDLGTGIPGGYSGADSGGAGVVNKNSGGGLQGTYVPPTSNGNWYTMSCPGQHVQSVFVPAGAGGTAPPPPLPPTPAEVVAATPFPIETIHHSPCYLGLTGLSGSLWVTANGVPVPPVSAAADIRGYTVQTTAQPVSYKWDMGNGDSVVGTVSGTRDAPSVRYTYQQTGAFRVTLTVTWSGTFTFSGYGVRETAVLPPVDQAPPRQLVWPVQGVVSVLVAPGYVSSTTVPSLPSAC